MTHLHTATGPEVSVSVALRRLWAGDMDCAERWLRELTQEQRRQAATVLRRLAVLNDSIRFEGLADKVATAHDLRVDPARVDAVLTYLAEPVPVGVDGFSIGGETR